MGNGLFNGEGASESASARQKGIGLFLAFCQSLSRITNHSSLLSHRTFLSLLKLSGLLPESFKQQSVKLIPTCLIAACLGQVFAVR